MLACGSHTLSRNCHTFVVALRTSTNGQRQRCMINSATNQRCQMLRPVLSGIVHASRTLAPARQLQLLCGNYATRSQAARGGSGSSTSRRPRERMTPDLRDLQMGQLVKGTVQGIEPFGVFVKLLPSGPSGLLHISQISQGKVLEGDLQSLFTPQEEIKALVHRVDVDQGRLALSTKLLEHRPGDMLNNRAAMFAAAEQTEAEVNRERARRPQAGSGTQGNGESGVAQRGVGRRQQDRAVQDVQKAVREEEVEEKEEEEKEEGRRAAMPWSSERQATKLEVGQLLEGVVASVMQHEMCVQLLPSKLLAVMHKSQISKEKIRGDLNNFFQPGEKLKGLVLASSMKKGRKQLINLGTKHLEQNRGDMLHKREAVWETAEEMAAAFRKDRAEKMQAGVAASNNTGAQKLQASGATQGLGRSQSSKAPAQKAQKAEAGEGQDGGDSAPAAVDLKDAQQLEGEVVAGVVRRLIKNNIVVELPGLGPVGHLPLSKLSRGKASLEEIEDIFTPGTQIKALVKRVDVDKGKVVLYTKVLERLPGELLINPEAVFAQAEERAALYLESREVPEEDGTTRVSGKKKKPVAKKQKK